MSDNAKLLDRSEGQWFWFEANGVYLGKVLTTTAEIRATFHCTIGEDRLVTILKRP